MNSAKDKLIMALDTEDLAGAMYYVKLLKDHVGVFKIGLELFVKEGPRAVTEVREAAPDCGIFLDLKFHDIPATVKRAFINAASLGVDFTTAHVGGGSASLEAISGCEESHKTMALGVTVLTSLSTEDLSDVGVDTVRFAEPSALVLHRAALARESGLRGVVSSPREVAAIKAALGEDFIVVTPGIRPLTENAIEDDQKRVATPYSAVLDGSDYIVVGRPIRDAPDPLASASAITKEIERALQDRTLSKS